MTVMKHKTQHLEQNVLTLPMSNIITSLKQTKIYRSPKRALSASWIAQLVKNLPGRQETWVWPLTWEDPLRRKWQPFQYSCQGNPMDNQPIIPTYTNTIISTHNTNTIYQHHNSSFCDGCCHMVDVMLLAEPLPQISVNANQPYYYSVIF